MMQNTTYEYIPATIEAGYGSEYVMLQTYVLYCLNKHMCYGISTWR